MSGNVKNHGEGDKESAKKYNESAESFTQSEEGRRAAGAQDHNGKASDEELAQAKKNASSRAKEHDPEARRDFSKPAD